MTKRHFEHTYPKCGFDSFKRITDKKHGKLRKITENPEGDKHIVLGGVFRHINAFKVGEQYDGFL